MVDRVRTNQMPNVTNLYQTERKSRQEQYENYPVPSEDISFDVRIETEHRRVCPITGRSFLGLHCAILRWCIFQVYRSVQRLLMEYKDARRGPTVIFIQSPIGGHQLNKSIPALDEFPTVSIPHVER